MAAVVEWQVQPLPINGWITTATRSLPELRTRFMRPRFSISSREGAGGMGFTTRIHQIPAI